MQNRSDESSGQNRVPIVLVTPSENAVSETFIRAHIERLPFEVHPVFGSGSKMRTGDGLFVSPVIRWLVTPMEQVFSMPLRQRLDHWRLGRLIRRVNARAVLAEYGPTGVHVMDTCRRMGVPLVVHFHGYDAYVTDVLERHRVGYAQLFEIASAIVVVSREMEERLIQLGASRDRLHYIPYGVDSSSFVGADPLHSPPLLVAVGRLTEKKAPMLTLVAFRTVLDQRPDARLTFLGDGPLLGACKTLVRGLRLDQAVSFLGSANHQAVSELLRKARCFVQHSIQATNGDSEGTPVAILEAGAAGLPVISTRHAGIKDVVTDEETGLLVDEGDVEGMARCMLTVLADPELAARLGAAARSRIVENYSMERRIEALAAVVRGVMGTRESKHV